MSITCLYGAATGKEMVREKTFFKIPGKVREFYFESRKIDIWSRNREN